MGKSRDDPDTDQDLARELAALAAQLVSMKGEANVWLSDESYTAPSGTVRRTPTLLSRRPRWRRGGAVRLNEGHEQ